MPADGQDFEIDVDNLLEDPVNLSPIKEGDEGEDDKS